MSITDTIRAIKTQWLVSIFAENVTNIQINLKKCLLPAEYSHFQSHVKIQIKFWQI